MRDTVLTNIIISLCYRPTIIYVYIGLYEVFYDNDNNDNDKEIQILIKNIDNINADIDINDNN